MEISSVPHVRVAVVGTGFGGIAAAARLLRDGETSVAVFERGASVGGVWRANRYPGAACDVQSHLYELSLAPGADWSRRFATQPEIEAYLCSVAERTGMLSHVRFHTDVAEAVWDAAAALWRLETSRGPWTASVLVAAPGALAEPRRPDIAGLDTFAGPVVHTALWPDGLDLAGKRVAVVGTGASAVQVVPALQPSVSHLTVFQRSAPYIMPRHDRALAGSTRQALLRSPRLRRGVREALYRVRETYGLTLRHPRVGALAGLVARLHLRLQVRDAALRARLAPADTFGCRRVLLSDAYYPALAQPNVTLAEGAAVAFRPGAVVDAAGVAHAADAVVLATGFTVAEMPFARRVVGRGGRRLADVWRARHAAHVGTTVAGFPNLFVIGGPNTSLGHTSVVLTIEAQVEHLIGALAYSRAHGVAAVEPRPEAQAAFVADVDRMSAATVWTSGCRSGYVDSQGRNVALWPGTVAAFRRRVAPFDPAEYHLLPAPVPAVFVPAFPARVRPQPIGV